MNITLIQDQMAYIELTLETEDEFEVYGGTTRAPFEFQPTGVASWRVVVRESEVAGSALRPFDIYARQRSSGREWVVLSGKIIVKPRTADIEGDKLSPVEYHVSVPVVDSVLETQGMAIVTGIPGPQGPKGDKGDPGDGGMTSEERATLAGAAQRGGDNTFTASNTFTGSVDMSTAQVIPPEGWNVEGVTAEAIQAVVPIAWDETSVAFGEEASNMSVESVALGARAKTTARGSISVGVRSEGGISSVSVGSGATSGEYSISFGTNAASFKFGVAIGAGAMAKKENTAIGSYSNANASRAMAIGYAATVSDRGATGITLGAAFTEVVNGQNVTHTCKTEGTGSITIGAGANTLNNGDTESSNSVTIGCKASNTGADSVVIGAQASGTYPSIVTIGAGSSASSESISVGGKSNANWWAVALGCSAQTGGVGGCSVGKAAKTSDYGIALGCSSNAQGYGAVAAGGYSVANATKSIALGYAAKVSDLGATVIRSTAEDGTYTQLYFSGANTPLANTYHDGAPMLGYVTNDSAGNIVAAGTRSLIDLLTDNSTFAPASLDENGEWVMPKVFHPSDLDLPSEEPSEVKEYQPLPVYPIVEPEMDELRTPTDED